MGKNDQWREEMEKMDSRKMSGFSLGSLLKEKLEIKQVRDSRKNGELIRYRNGKKVIGRPNGD
jgi:hypothetical protein